MAEGCRHQRRIDLAEQSMLVWGMDSIDLENYLFTGQMIDTGKGGPVEVSPEVQAAIDAEVARIRRENSDLPTFQNGDD